MVSGSGNVAIYTIEKVSELGGKVIVCSDSSNYVHDERGIDLELLKQVKEGERLRVSEYVARRKHARVPHGNIWSLPCQVAMPSAIQNELTGKDAERLAPRIIGAKGLAFLQHSRVPRAGPSVQGESLTEPKGFNARVTFA
ncbi:MAG TPA: hypothetical protein VFK05_24700 [Polyangiaceae bacterium]|nr:hypothetical protein [Polyangiaceae bacterium]